MFFQTIFCVLLVHVTRCYYDDDTYRAAVVSLANRTTVNIFEDYIKIAKDRDAEIVVFPELSLVMLPENITLGETPHENPEYYTTKPIQYRLSGAAREHQIYVALSIFEHGEKCNISSKTHCLFGWYMYNTEVVFDRTGKIVLKYRKAHNFLDYLEDVIHHGPGLPRYFDSDFGIRFGTWICFDIFFEQPQTDLLNKYGIQHFIYSEDWYDVIPITAVTFVQGWARHFDVNILCANNQLEKVGYESTGSGIFHRGTPLAWTISTDNEILVADVPKKWSHDDKNINLKNTPSQEEEQTTTTPVIRDSPENDHFKLENATYVFLASPGTEEQDRVLEIEDLKCRFSFKVTDVEDGKDYEPQWFIMMVTAFEFGVLDFEACFFQNCGEKREDCKMADLQANKQTTTMFDYIQVETTIVYPEDVFMVLPVLGGNDKSVFYEGQFEFKEEKNVYTVTSTDKLYEPVLFMGHAGVLKKPNEKYRKLN